MQVIRPGRVVPTQNQEELFRSQSEERATGITQEHLHHNDADTTRLFHQAERNILFSVESDIGN